MAQPGVARAIRKQSVEDRNMRILMGAAGVIASIALVTSAAMAPADLIKTIDAHMAAVNALAVSPDGAVGFSGGKDGKVILWDTKTDEKISEIPACQVAVNDIAVSPDGTLIATAGNDGYVKVWDATTTELKMAIDAHQGPCNTVAFTDMNNSELRLYSGGDDGYLRGWSVADNYKMVHEFQANEGGVNAIVINQAGSYVFTGGVDGRVCVFNINGGTKVSTIQAYDNAEVLCLGLNHGESCLVTGGTNGEVKGWDANTGSLVKTIRAHAGNVTRVTWTEDDKMVVSSGEDGKIKLWNHDGDLAGQFQAHVLGVRDFLLVPGAVVTAGSDFKIRLWKRNF
jgi:WD40 repeat protein